MKWMEKINSDRDRARKTTGYIKSKNKMNKRDPEKKGTV